MKAVTYQGIKNVEVREVKDPSIKNPDDIIVKITSSAICGSERQSFLTCLFSMI